MIDRTLNDDRHVLKSFLHSIGDVRSALDIGAGRGDDLSTVRDVYPSAQLHAVECFAENVQTLTAQGIDVRSLNIEHDPFPFDPESLDLVMANQILEHTKEVFWILDQASRVLKVGGHLLLGVPNLASLHNRFLLAFGRQPSSLKNSSAHVRGFTKPDVLELLNSGFPGGYRLIRFGGSNFYPFPPLLARPLAKLLPTMAWAIFFDFEKVKPYTGQFLNYPKQMQLETNFYIGKL